VLHQIGAGTLGPVFRGHDTERERLVAVKLFKLDLTPETTHRLVAGLERLVEANLAHPSIATPVAAGVTDVSAYLAMDYVAADSLDLALREVGPSSAADALLVAARVAGALDHAFAAGFTHGCLHPRDVLMAGQETRVTGIGIGQLLADLGVPVPVRRPYTAPERAEGQSWDRRADVFSLAALVHELLWGKRVSGTGSQAVEGITPLAGGELDSLRRVFKRALAEDPGERHPTPKIFVDALKRAFPDLVVDLAAAVAPPPRARNLRLATPSRAPKPDPEPLLPLATPELDGEHSEQRREQPRFTDVDIAPAASALNGPSVLEDAPIRGEARPTALTEDEHPHDPLALSWLSREAEPSKEPLKEPLKEPPSAAVPAPIADMPIRLEPEPEPVIAVEALPIEQPAVIEQVEPPHEERIPERREPREPRETTQPVPFELTMLDRSRSAVWPLVLAMVIGVTLGFAGGYAVGVREHPAAVAAATPTPAVPAREFTEGTLPDAPKPAPASDVRADAPPTTAPAAAAARSAAPARVTPAPAPAPPKAWAAGRLNVRSTPAGAKVIVDDREAGRTPMAVRDLTEGPHRIRIARDGYAAHDRRIVITRDRPAQLVTATLARQTPPPARPAASTAARTPAPPPAAPVGRGALTIDSRPAGARVFLDGKLVGTTPMSPTPIDAGDHAIRLEHDGYKNWTGAVRIVASEQARVTASLER
jgi:serine/threonine protein kinase